MSNTLNNENGIKKERQAQLLRKLWLGLIIVMVFIVLFELYGWSQGKTEFRSILTPTGMIFLGLSRQLPIARNRTLRYIFLALAMIFLVVSLVTLFVNR